MLSMNKSQHNNLSEPKEYKNVSIIQPKNHNLS